MRKTKEICRLAHDVDLSGRAIARVLGVSNSTVSDTLSRLAVAKLSWPKVETMSETELERRIYREQGNVAPDPLEPDWEYVRTELSRRHVTLQLLWHGYRADHPDGYGYSWFCAHYRSWLRKADPVMRQVHVFGETTFVDWAGDTVGVIDAETGEEQRVYLFVAVLGASNFTYVEASRSQDTESFLTAHVHAFAYFGGVSSLVVCDNLKTGVRRADRYDPDLNPEYAELAAHYGTAILPARVHKPRDKAKVECAVRHAYRMILAPLRNRTFFSLSELNEEISALLEVLNDRPFKKMSGSRRSVYLKDELPVLRPLPARAYHYRTHKSSKVHIDYHIELAAHRYSVPHRLIGQRVEVFIDERMVEIYHEGQRVALHARGHIKGGYTTDASHMPDSHREYGAWTPERMEKWVAASGPACAALAGQIMKAVPNPALGYRSCLGLIGLGRKYGEVRLEAACARALACGAHRYRSVRSILEKGLDATPLAESSAPPPIPGHDNLRGPDYYQ